MPRRTLHRRRRAQGGCLSFAIGALAVVALALAVAIFITNRIPSGQNDLQAEPADASPAPTAESQLVIGPGGEENAEPVPTASPSPTPDPTATPAPTFNPDDPYALVRPQPLNEHFLPIFEKANTDEKAIAITVDECSGATITRSFASAAAEYGAKLTLFPTGENVLKPNMGDVLRVCLYQLGFEIENRCYSTTAKLYTLDDTNMAAEIWKQYLSVSYVLGVRYPPHFLRLYGGDGLNDGRTHLYLKQQGYLGIASWTVNGSAISPDRIADSLAPGNIYFFKTTEKDLSNMKLLMEEARRQGYRMVTLNELFGYEENAWDDHPGNLMAETLPELQGEVPYYFMMKGDCTWATNLLQRRLIELGYLAQGSADGVFGSGTAAALSAFQARLGLAATGAADVATQERLFADDAPPNNAPVPSPTPTGESAVEGGPQ